MGIEELLIERAKYYGRLEGKVEGKAEGKVEGKVEGEQSKSRLVIENLILNFNFTDQQAASATGVTLSFVKKVRAGLNEKK